MSPVGKEPEDQKQIKYCLKCLSSNIETLYENKTDQRMFLSCWQFKSGIIQALHKVPQTWNVHLVFDSLRLKYTEWTRQRERESNDFQICKECTCTLITNKFLRISVKWKNSLTAATGTRISTKRPAKACLMSLSFTSRKYCAHSCEEKEHCGTEWRLQTIYCTHCTSDPNIRLKLAGINWV